MRAVMSRNRLNWDCDRQAKKDFTATTYAICTASPVYSSVTFYEKDKNGDFVPFGSISASQTSHYDVWMDFTTSAWTKRYVFELKERHNPDDRYSTAIINEEKWPEFVRLRKEGIIPMWVELYDNGKIRIWNLNSIDFNKLNLNYYEIKKINIDPDSEKKWQTRREIPMEWGKTYGRIRG